MARRTKRARSYSRWRHFNPLYRLCRRGNRFLRKHAVVTNRTADVLLGMAMMAVIQAYDPDIVWHLTTLLLVPTVGKVRLDRLTGEQVQQALNTLQTTGLAPRTLQYIRAVLRTALGQAVKWGHIARNPADASEAPQVMKFKIEALTIQQAKQLLEAVAGHRLEVLYRIALSLGLRRGEVLGLRWQDVDLEKGVLRITGQVQTIKGKTMRMPSPKTQAGVREIPLPAILVAALQRHYALQQDERSTIDVEWEDHDLIFPSRRGTPMQPRNLIRHFKTVLGTAKLPLATRFHDLRHSCATLLIAQGVPLKTVSDILGHSSIQITADIYGHSQNDQKRDATEQLGQLFESNNVDDNEAEKGG
jgi:integrase